MNIDNCYSKSGDREATCNDHVVQTQNSTYCTTTLIIAMVLNAVITSAFWNRCGRIIEKGEHMQTAFLDINVRHSQEKVRSVPVLVQYGQERICPTGVNYGHDYGFGTRSI